MSGWIKLQRDIMDHWIAQDCEYLAVWIRMLAEANFDDRKSVINGALVEVKRGQLVFGLESYSAKTGVSIKRLRRLLELLESDGMIGRQRSNKFSLITITNYCKHQCEGSQKAGEGQAQGNQKASTGQAQGNTIRSKENKELKNKKDISPDQPKNDKPDEVAEVFAHWQQVMSHPKAKLDAKRTKLIRSAIKNGYTAEDLKNAITGYTKSPWHMGQNPSGTRYDNLETLIRDAKQIDTGLKHLENNAGVKPYGNQTHHNTSHAGRYENPTARLLRMAREYEPAADTGNIIEADFKAH